MDRRKKYTIIVVSLLGLSLLLMIGICMLIWGKRISSFDTVQMTLLIVLAVLEAATMSAEFFFASRLSKMNNTAEESEGKAAVRRSTDRRGIAISAVGILVAFCATFIGFLIGKGIRGTIQNIMLLSSAAVALIPAAILAAAAGKAKTYGDDIRRRIAFEKKRRQCADTECESLESKAERELLLLTSMLKGDDALAVTVGMLGIVSAFLAGLSCSVVSTAILLVDAMWILVAFSRIRPSQVDVAVEDCEYFLSPEDCPELYALARRAQDNIEAEGIIRISLTYGGTVEAHQAGNVCTLTIGVIALDFLSEAELYCLILHEFSRINSNEDNYYTVIKHYDWMSNGGNPSIVSPVSELMFRCRTLEFELEYQRYMNTVSALYECEADAAMTEFGDALCAASAILKKNYISLYEWEDRAKDFVPYYASETPNPGFVAETVDSFRKAFSERSEAWNRLTENEISPIAGKKTAFMRISGLRTSDPFESECKEREEYRIECGRAIKLFSESVCNAEDVEGYALMREELYIKPLEAIEAWESEEKPLNAENYYGIVDTLTELGRVSEAEELCDRVIKELPEEECFDAMFYKASNMLSRYDDGGIELLKKLTQADSYYEELGRDAMIEYLCLTGNAEMLEPFLEELYEEEKELEEALVEEPKEFSADIYEEAEVIRREDDLSPETLPEGMLEDIITYLRAIDDNEIEKVFLLKKTVTEEFSTSVFIIKLALGTSDERGYEIMQSIFSYLDTCSDRQFSLFEYTEVFDVEPERFDGSLVYENTELAETVPEEAEEVQTEE